MGTTRSELESPGIQRNFAIPSSAAVEQPARSPGCAAPPTPIAGIIFDVENVLHDATLWRRWLLRLVNQLGRPAEYEAFYRAWDRDYLVDVHCGRREFTEALQAFLLASGLSWAQLDEAEAASRIQREELDRRLRPWPGVAKTLAALDDRGLRLAAWFDTCLPAAELIQRLEPLGLGSHFHAVLSSIELECAQPAAQCYFKALASLELRAAETLYVSGDAARLAAARSLGMRTAAFNSQPHAQADFHLTRFEELLAIANHAPTSILSASPSPPADEVRRSSPRLAAGNRR